jgi:hypothetical protein
MTITITASPSTVPGAAYLSITTDNPVISLMRADKNGTRPVRLPADSLPFTDTQTFMDYEPALSGDVQYRAKTAYGTAEVWMTMGAQGPRFTIPALPLITVGVDTVFDYAATRESRATVHDVPGRADPIVVQARMGTRRGTLAIVCDSHVDLMDLENLFQQGKTVMFRQSEHSGMDMYFHALTSAVVPSTGKWELTVSYVELSYPAGPVMDPGTWTFEDLALTGDTFAETAATYPTFTALLLDTP